MNRLSKLKPIANSIMLRARPTFEKHLKYSKIELAPPNPAQIKEFFTTIGKSLETMSVSKFKDLTVREAFTRFLIGLEISCWFFIGECIGKGSIIGYQTAPMSHVLGNFKLPEENGGSGGSPTGGDKNKPTVTRRTNEEAKKENTDAYDKVGENAKNFVGDSRIARANMKYLGYTDDQLSHVKDDLFNFQGVGCPFPFINISPGDRVLDVGSGLGLDTIIAHSLASPNGKVIGVDLSEKECEFANQKVSNQSLSNIKFIAGDMESFPDTPEFSSNSFDKVISNGAFCMAPDKKKAFEEIHRVLKPGGKMAICTSVTLKTLETSKNWPLCMEMFTHIDKLEPLCKEIGFKNIEIDTSNSLMNYPLEVDIVDKPKQSETAPENFHEPDDKYSHVKKMDMNEWIARVVVIAEK